MIAVFAGGVEFLILTAMNYQNKTNAGYDITFSESAVEVYEYKRAKFFELKNGWLQ